LVDGFGKYNIAFAWNAAASSSILHAIDRGLTRAVILSVIQTTQQATGGDPPWMTRFLAVLAHEGELPCFQVLERSG
jgi:hypothetical protein